jgi:heavy metal sensor kinase
MLKSLRTRLTAWYLLFFTALLAAFSGFLYARLSRSLREQLASEVAARAETAAGLFRDEYREMNGDAEKAAAEAVTEARSPNAVVSVWDGARLLAASGAAPAGPVVQSAAPAWRYSVVAAAPLAPLDSQLRSLRRVFFFLLPLALLVAGVGGFLLASRSLAPLAAIAAQAARITERNLDERLRVDGAATEFVRLAHSFNSLLERLEAAFTTMRRFVADASHELRTPLAVIRGESDIALARERRPAEYRQSLEIVHDEAARLSRLVDDLLNLARADAGRRPLHVEEFYLDDLLQECCRSLQALAAFKRIDLECACPEDVAFRGDQELLRRLVSNLLDNAIRYTREGGAVAVRLEPGDTHIRIVVADTGVGIPAECAPHVFERFYRVDPARSRGDGGFGLGLPIARWIAEAHAGTLELTSSSELGSTFTVSLAR